MSVLEGSVGGAPQLLQRGASVSFGFLSPLAIRRRVLLASQHIPLGVMGPTLTLGAG